MSKIFCYTYIRGHLLLSYNGLRRSPLHLSAKRGRKRKSGTCCVWRAQLWSSFRLTQGWRRLAWRSPRSTYSSASSPSSPSQSARLSTYSLSNRFLSHNWGLKKYQLNVFTYGRICMMLKDKSFVKS